MPRTEEVYEALKAVKLTEIGKDVVAAGAVRNLVISGGAVSFDLKVLLPHAPLPSVARIPLFGFGNLRLIL